MSIPSVALLVSLLAVAAGLGVATAFHRRRVFAGPDQPPVTEVVWPEAAAYLNGGAWHAVRAAMARLRNAGVVDVQGGGLVPVGALPADATPLEQAIYGVAQRQGPAQRLSGDPFIRQAMNGLRLWLESRGLVPTAQQVWTARIGPMLMAAIIFVAIVAVFPSGPFWLLPMALALAGLPLYAWLRAPRRTAAGERVLEALRTRYPHLRHDLRPAWQTYGPAAVAMGVALNPPALSGPEVPDATHDDPTSGLGGGDPGSGCGSWCGSGAGSGGCGAGGAGSGGCGAGGAGSGGGGGGGGG